MADELPASEQEPIATPVAAEPAVVPDDFPFEGRGRKYDTLVLLPAGTEGEALENVTKEIQSILETQGAVNIQVNPMGRRALAYKIREHAEGQYVDFLYSAPTAAIAPVDRALRLKESIIRFLTVTVD